MALPLVLVVDDNDLVRGISDAVLSQHGYPTVQASSAAGALTVLGDEPDVAVVVTDLAMPGEMDGGALVDHLRASHPEIGIVVTTGLMGSVPSFDDEVIVLLKPFGIDDLVRAVEQVAPRTDEPAAQ